MLLQQQSSGGVFGLRGGNLTKNFSGTGMLPGINFSKKDGQLDDEEGDMPLNGVGPGGMTYFKAIRQSRSAMRMNSGLVGSSGIMKVDSNFGLNNKTKGELFVVMEDDNVAGSPVNGGADEPLALIKEDVLRENETFFKVGSKMDGSEEVKGHQSRKQQPRQAPPSIQVNHEVEQKR